MELKIWCCSLTSTWISSIQSVWCWVCPHLPEILSDYYRRLLYLVYRHAHTSFPKLNPCVWHLQKIWNLFCWYKLTISLDLNQLASHLITGSKLGHNCNSWYKQWFSSRWDTHPKRQHLCFKIYFCSRLLSQTSHFQQVKFKSESSYDHLEKTDKDLPDIMILTTQNVLLKKAKTLMISVTSLFGLRHSLRHIMSDKGENFNWYGLTLYSSVCVSTSLDVRHTSYLNASLCNKIRHVFHLICTKCNKETMKMQII